MQQEIIESEPHKLQRHIVHHTTTDNRYIVHHNTKDSSWHHQNSSEPTSTGGNDRGLGLRRDTGDVRLQGSLKDKIVLFLSLLHILIQLLSFQQRFSVASLLFLTSANSSVIAASFFSAQQVLQVALVLQLTKA